MLYAVMKSDDTLRTLFQSIEKFQVRMALIFTDESDADKVASLHSDDYVTKFHPSRDVHLDTIVEDRIGLKQLVPATTMVWYKVRTIGDYTLWKFDDIIVTWRVLPNKEGKPTTHGGYYTIAQAAMNHKDLRKDADGTVRTAER